MRTPCFLALALVVGAPLRAAEPTAIYPSSDVRMMIVKPQPSILGSDDTTRELNVGDTKDDTEWRSVIVFDLSDQGAAINKAKSVMLQLTLYRTIGNPLSDVEVVAIEPIDASRSFPSDGSSAALATLGTIPAGAKRGDRFEFDVTKAAKDGTFIRRVGFRLQLAGGQTSKNATADSLVFVAGSKPLDANSGLTDADRPQLIVVE